MKNKSITIVAAHPDDEILGAGGTLIRHCRSGYDVHCLVLGEGVLSRDASSKDMQSSLLKNAMEAAKIIGFKKIDFANLPDNAFDTVSLLSVTKIVEKFLNEVNPHIVYTHHEYDLNVDHRIAFQAVLTAARPGVYPELEQLLTFETLSSTEWQRKDFKTFQPNVYVDISSSIDQKIKALAAYTSEVRPYPHPRSLEGIRILSQYRGMESGLMAAEAFCEIRRIVR